MKLIALSGLPNTGKTSLFNALTKGRAKVGNYAGITVERRSATFQLDTDEQAELLDVPGAYSLVARSGEEKIAFESTLGLNGQPKPDVVVACVDATSPLRSLYFVQQLSELGLRVVVALTMVDEAGIGALSASDLSKAIGYKVVSVDARHGKGLTALRRAIRATLANDPPPANLGWTPSEELADHIANIRTVLPVSLPDTDAIALWALMSIGANDELTDISDKLRKAVEANESSGAKIDEEVITKRYALLKTRIDPLIKARKKRLLTDRIDRILIHRVSGFIAFIVLMMTMFQALFSWCDPIIGWIEVAFEWLSRELTDLLPTHLISELLIDGVIAGVGAVLVFIPQILLLFFIIGFLEDVGYMARVAVLMDRIMSKMNLHGRAFVPMLSGFACAVPAIMATRTMERKRDRLLTMMVVPLMTCSARLPVYTLIIAALIPPQSFFGMPVQGLLMVAMYLFSIFIALIAAWVLSRTVTPLKGKGLPLVVELPPYRMPRIRDVVIMMWERTSIFVREAGTVILTCTVILWLLLTFPRAAELPQDASPELERAVAAEQLSNSYAGRVGHVIEPTIAPLGFDWKIGIGIVGAFAAREVFVSTMGVVYAVEANDGETTALRDRLRHETKSDGSRAYTPLVGLSLMIFFALACQCMSTLAVVKRETGGYHWPLFLFAYMTTVAWLMSFVVYQIGTLLGF